MRPDNQLPTPPAPANSAGPHLPLALLRQYVAGALPAAEQHRVEAHTLTCARCADVLDGLAQTDPAATDRAVAELHTRLRARLATEAARAAPPAVPLWPAWRQLAATVLLLLVAAAVWLGVRRTTEGPTSAPTVALRRPAARPETAPDPPAPELPSAEPAPAAAPPPPADKLLASAPAAPAKRPVRAGQPRPARPVPAATVQAEESYAVADAEAADAASPAAASPAAPAAAASVPADTLPTQADGVARAYSKAKRATASANASRAQRPAAPARIAAAEESKKLAGRLEAKTASAAGTRVVRGRVTDQTTGAGLLGVTVSAKGTDLGASTAADGSFALTVPAAVSTLTFSYVGYTTAERAVPAGDLALALTPDTRQLSEVVVRREPPPAPVSIGALPTGGYRAYRDYLRRELEYPEEALKKETEGSVKLSFTVAVDGTLQDLKVVKGLSAECDAEALRLVKEGPSWHAAIVNGRRTARLVQLSVPFRIADQR